jgi:hypothetical protein
VIYLFGFIIGWLGISSFFIVIGIWLINDTEKKRERCTDTVEATVVDIEMTGLFIEGKGKKRDCYPVYEFYYCGKYYRRTSNDIVHKYRFSVGDHVELAINPKYPDEFHILEDISGIDKGGLISIIVGAGAILFMLVQFILSLF